ncbi:STAS domain-containing protein [Stratiformator vulcanicus]|uniref:Anti-sigma factor antagonist BtrV n=1 Tax=Stratiformator vulcanicus TaxID=2527980 RepID=A0A517QW91_9PLAN|nr:STAS domain-containing protein [Stratiformator vulcanicus]QDT35935.1 Putative anti-sigma factor antagonist BtrV [Stratiformator vulcanicus]
MPDGQEDFRLEWHGNAVVIIPTGDVESMRWDLIEQAADVVMEPLADHAVPMVVFDLSEIDYFGSVFLALMIRCHKFVRSKGGEMVLCGATPKARELLHVTALDTIWAIYDTREEALEAVGG